MARMIAGATSHPFKTEAAGVKTEFSVASKRKFYRRNTMNTTKAAGVLDQAKGKVKQVVGETFNNQKLANEGAADQVKGNVKEAWGNVKDTANRIGKTKAADTKMQQE